MVGVMAHLPGSCMQVSIAQLTQCRQAAQHIVSENIHGPLLKCIHSEALPLPLVEWPILLGHVCMQVKHAQVMHVHAGGVGVETSGGQNFLLTTLHTKTWMGHCLVAIEEGLPLWWCPGSTLGSCKHACHRTGHHAQGRWGGGGGSPPHCT